MELNPQGTEIIQELCTRAILVASKIKTQSALTSRTTTTKKTAERVLRVPFFIESRFKILKDWLKTVEIGCRLCQDKTVTSVFRDCLED